MKKRPKSGKIVWCREALPPDARSDPWNSGVSDRRLSGKLYFAAEAAAEWRNMKRQKQRHKHKESFSVLLIPNTGGKSKQFHVTRFSVRVCVSALVLVLLAVTGAAVWTGYQFSRQENIRRQLTQQKEKIETLEAEKQALEQEKGTLIAEMETLQQEKTAAAETASAADAGGEAEEESIPEKDTSVPRRYPYTGISTVLSNYSAEQPYLSLNTDSDGNVVATGDGMVVTVDADDTYAHIIEVEHNNGYKTRYMCRQEAQSQMQVGAQVQAGDILLTVLTDDTQLDYQILFEEEAIDPLTVFEAKG